MTLDSQLLTVQILTNDIQVLIFCLSYIITTVTLRKLQNSQNPPLIGEIDFVEQSCVEGHYYIEYIPFNLLVEENYSSQGKMTYFLIRKYLCQNDVMNKKILN